MAEQHPVPKTIGRYQVLGTIGIGAMGAVYKAFDPLIKRTLAIKTIRLDIARGSPEYKQFLDRFYHEARISGTLAHPGIVTLFDIGEDVGGSPYLAMEFIEGETVESMIERGVRFRPEKVIGLASQVAGALDYAHQRGVVHRDIKPSNLILFEQDRIKVMDFGIAKLAGSELTQAGQLLGTPSYMSPEQAMGEKLDGRSDIFSLGVVCFEMLSGEQPFPGNNVTSILYRLVHMPPAEPQNLELHGLVPQKWHEVFSRVLAKRPDQRYQTAAEFVQDLELCLGSWFAALPGDADEEADPGERTMLDDEGFGDALPVPILHQSPHDAPPAARFEPPAAEEPEVDTESTAEIETQPVKPPPRAAGPNARTEPLPVTDEADAPLTQVMPTTDGGVDMASIPAPPPPPPPAAAALPPPRAPRPPLPPPPPPLPFGDPVVDHEAAPSTVTLQSSAQADEEGADAAERTVIDRVGEVASAEATVGMPVGLAAPDFEDDLPPAAATVAMPLAAPAAEDVDPAEATVAMTSAEALAGALTAARVVPPARVMPPPAPRAVMDAAAEATVLAPGPLVPPPPPPPVPPPPPPMPPPPRSSPRLTARPAPPPAAPPAASANPSPRGNHVLLIAAGTGFVAMALGIAGLFFLRGPATPATPPSTAGPFTAGLRVLSQPSGAAVSVNGEIRGNTPLTLGLSHGFYEVEVELSGHETVRESVALTQAAPARELSVQLSRATVEPNSGLLEVVTQPPGASVQVDGVPVGATPLRRFRLPAGPHKVELEAPDCEPEVRQITITAAETERLSVSMRSTRIHQLSELDAEISRVAGKPVQLPAQDTQVFVVVTLTIGLDGRVEKAEITESAGEELDQAVRDAVRRWRYEPGRRNGMLVRVRFPLKIRVPVK